MMVIDLIEEFNTIGVELWTEAGQLKFRAGKGVLTDEHKARLRQHKSELIAYLELVTQADADIQVKADSEHRFDAFPLTHIQTAYVLGRQNAFGYGGTGCHGYLELQYPELNPAQLERAWNQLIQRHPMLRATVSQQGFQQVQPEVSHYNLVQEDFSQCVPEQTEDKLNAIRAELEHKQYPLDQWPMFEMRYSRTAQGHIVHFSMDALIADWASAEILFVELDSLLLDQNAVLPELKIDFRDYLIAERSLIDTPAYEQAARYWQSRIAELPLAPELPSLNAPADIDKVEFKRHHLRFPLSQWQVFKQSASKAGLTPSVAVLAAYAAVLQRWSRQSSFCLSLTLLNRMPLHEQVNQLIGDFTSVSVLAIDGKEPQAFAQWAKKIGQQLFNDLDHRLFSGVEVLREMAKKRGSEAALMPVVFTSAIGLGETAAPPTGRKSGRGITQTPQVTLDCQVRDDAFGLEINWDVRQGVFPLGLVEDMFNAFTELLSALAECDDVAVLWQESSPVALTIWQQQERVKANQTQAPLAEQLLHQGILQRIEQQPNAIAIIDKSTEVSYQTLAQQAKTVCATLQQQGVKAGDKVAVALSKNWHQIAATLGVLMAGAVYLPLDPKQPKLRLNKIIELAQVRHVLAHSKDHLLLDNTERFSTIVVDQLNHTDSEIKPVEVTTEQLAYVIYTSGSTGEPKGVMISHNAAVNTILDINKRYQVNAQDKVLGLAQLSFDLSVFDIFGVLGQGGTLVLPNQERGAEPSHWAELLEQHQITIWNSVPAQLQMLTSYLDSQAIKFENWRLALLSGDWIPVTLPEQIRRHVPALQMIAMGGATEAAIWSNYHDIVAVDPSWNSIPYGLPLANQGFRVLDQALRDAPVWVAGELMITGAGLAEGYLADEILSEQKFFHHPVDGQRLYRTGDLGRYLPGGEIEFLGREDGQVKIRGHRIELGEIDSALLTHPAVATAITVIDGVGAANKQLTSFVETQFLEKATTSLDSELVEAVSRFALFQAGEVTDIDMQRYHYALEEAALLSMLDSLIKRELFTSKEQSLSAEQILTNAKISQQYHWLIRLWLDKLTQADFLTFDPATEQYQHISEFDSTHLDNAWRQVKLAEDMGFSESNFIQYYKNHLSQLPQILSGEQQARLSSHPSELIARHNNAAVAALVNRIVANSERKISILELGAGSGSTTASILPILDGYEVDYQFTDVDKSHLSDARQHFAEYPWLQFGLFDINMDYRKQGMAPNSVDVIICVDTLNGTQTPELTLQRATELLAPGGWLIFVEPTQDLAHLLLTKALVMTPTDNDRAFGQSQFKSSEQWQQLLQQNGAGEVLILPEGEQPLSRLATHVFAAQFKTEKAHTNQTELTAHLSQRVPNYMLPSHIQIVDQLPLTSNGKIDRKCLQSWRPQGVELQQSQSQEAMTPLEQALCQLWAEALGADSIGKSDNFFDQGADSLIMARVAGRLLEQIPEAQPFTYDALLRNMLNEPNVEALARSLQGSSHQDADESKTQVAATTRAGSNSLIVPFTNNPEDEQSGFVRVMFHAALGTLDYFQHLGKALAAQSLGPVIGMAINDVEQYLAIDTKQLIEKTADDYAQRLVDEGYQQCQLIGYCLGGLLATEVARRLMEKGIEVVDLTLIDSIPMFIETDEELAFEAIFAPNLNLDPVGAVFGEDVNPEDVYSAIAYLMQKHQGLVPAGAMAELSETPQLKAVADAVQLRNKLTQAQRLQEYTDMAANQAGIPVDAEMIPGLFNVCRHSMRAACVDLPPYIGDMTYLLCEEEQSFGVTAGVGHMAAPYWQNVCLGDFNLVQVPGNHFSVMEPPCVNTVVKHLGAALVEKRN
ncbi:non-ribosomal peptide synthetase [Aliivibrio fischeri]|uniref:Amino acid adenylation domain-containing protein n=1 Tax=Aliivibrio fischeri TaxID=668 RepID=A0A844P7D2_ALIFS|nr:non-ribosomal peptide synthetase [Aliivibrio fischeri]MUK51037.1 amino acid adenylation domain-containing protein [Aliivibrio fischeri]